MFSHSLFLRNKKRANRLFLNDWLKKADNIFCCLLTWLLFSVVLRKFSSCQSWKYPFYIHISWQKYHAPKTWKNPIKSGFFGDISFLHILYGGDGGNRTPVRKRFNKNFSGRRRLFTFPHPGGSRHPTGFGSFMMHGAFKALRTHVHHLSTPHPGPWYSRVERSLFMQREEQCCRCSLIYKCCPFYGW